jgi:outer membrane protein TolC
VATRLVSGLVVGLLVLFPTLRIALAAEKPSDTLLLSEVLAEALAQHPEIQAMRSRWKAAQERPAQVGALDDPEFKIELFNTPQSLDVTRSENTIFGLSQRFPFPGKRALRKTLSLKDADIAQAQLQEKERDIRSQVKVAYYDLFQASKAIEVHHQQIRLLKEFFEIANARFRAGKGAQVDVLKSSVELSKLHNELPVLEQQRESAQAKLNLLMSRSSQSPLGEPVGPIGLRQPYLLEELEQTALQYRPELRALDVEATKSHSAIALSQKQYYPDFNVMVERFQNFGQRDGFGGMVMMSLPFSFWTKPKYDAGVREAKANLESAKAVYQAMQNQVRFEIKDLLAKIGSAEKLLTLYKTTIIPQAEQTLAAARIGYQTGRVEFLTLVDAERALKEFQLEYYRTLSTLEQRRAELERAVGTELPGNSSS